MVKVITFAFALLLLSQVASAANELRYEVQMRWDPQTNSLSISENAIGLPPACEGCVSPIEWMQCGNNLNPKQISGQPGCETIDNNQGFSIDMKFNNAANCTASSTPYKPEWAMFVSNLPNGVTGVRSANLSAISEQTTLSITCEIGTAPLKVHSVYSMKLDDVLEDALLGALYFDAAHKYNIVDGQKRTLGLKTKMDVMKSKRVEYRLRQYGDSLLVVASTSRETVKIPPPQKLISPDFDVWVVITERPLEKNGGTFDAQSVFDVQSLGPACESLASNTKNKQVAINISSSGEANACKLEPDGEYWLTWYLLEKSDDFNFAYVQ